MNIKEDEVVLCTVTKIEGTTVFVEIEGGISGSISMSEVAAGRIRNLREYVTPNKKIVCKILKVVKDHIELSLRRVTGKERDEVMEKYKREKIAQTLLNNALKSNPDSLKKILADYAPYEFLAEAKANPSLIKKYVTAKDAELLQKMLADKKERERMSKRLFTLKSLSSSGLSDIKKILDCKDLTIHYLGSSQFSIEAKGKEFKEANQRIDDAVLVIQKKAKELKALFELKAQ